MPLVVSCGTVTVLLLLIKKMDMWVVWSLTKPYLKDLACINFNIIVGIANLASLS